jgi:dephospho-CoA kinase
MKILGVTAMPKSGKGELSEALKKSGWIHISMSGLLKRQIMKDTGLHDGEITRSTMFQQAAYYRKHHGGGYAAKLCLQEICNTPEHDKKKFIIDGIRHLGEIDVLNKLNTQNNVHFVGIIADENREKDKDIRKQRLKANPDQRGANFEDADLFDWIEYYEWDYPPHGPQVGACLDKVKRLRNGKILVNNQTIEKWKNQVESYAVELEGSHPSMEGNR